MVKRIEWIDIAKGITIMLMVIGHTSIPISISRLIYAFHMPLFFLASGMVTDWDKLRLWQFALHKLHTVMLPFVVYSIMVFGLMQITPYHRNIIDCLQYGWGGYALWFIPVLFIGSVLTKMIYMINNRSLRYVTLCGVLAVGWIFSAKAIMIPWNLSSIPYSCFMLTIGTELKPIARYWEKHLCSNCWAIIGLFVLTATISRFYHLDMCFNIILPIIPLTIGAVAGSTMIFMVSGVINRNTKYLSKVLIAVGKETYIVVAFSQITIIILNAYVPMHSILKYTILVAVLIALTYLKNVMNELCGTRIL